MSAPREILIIRFGSLGDLCLLGWSLSRLARPPASTACRVTLVTKAAYADLASRFTGVDAVAALRPGQPAHLVALANDLRGTNWDTVFDAHGVLRSDILTMLLGRRPRARIAKDTAARLRLLRGAPAGAALARTMRDRFDAVLAPLGPVLSRPPSPPLATLAGAPREALGIAPGAQWDTKRWPAEHFASCIQAFRQHSDAPVRVFLGPREADWFARSPLAALPGLEIWRDRALVDVAGGLAGCRLVVCNDSGLMHLAEAVGTPVVALFGPTVRAFGYFPQLPTSRVIEITDLDCRPCSRNGKRPCWRGDHACLVRIGPERVIAAMSVGRGGRTAGDAR